MKSKLSKIFSKIIMAAVGIILLIQPGAALVSLIQFLGIALLIIGGFGVISYIFSQRKGVISTLLFIGSIILALAALIPTFKPAMLVAIFPFVVGIVIAFNGLAGVFEAISMRTFSRIWGVPLLLSVLTVAAGCVIAFYPFETVELLVRIVGGVLIYHAVVGLFMAVTYKPIVEPDGTINITDMNK